MHHPLVGEIVLDTEAMIFPGDPDQMLIVFLAKPSSPARHALDLLASWTDDNTAQPAPTEFTRRG